jgi:hypothetical protein
MQAAALALLAAPAQAAPSPHFADVHPGAFVGARVKLELGHRTPSGPRAELALAPTRSSFSESGRVKTAIGEGLTLGVTRGSRPTLTLAGYRADQALGLRQGKHTSNSTKLGISDAGLIAIGIGVAAIAAGAIWLHDVIEDDKVSD